MPHKSQAKQWKNDRCTGDAGMFLSEICLTNFSKHAEGFPLLYLQFYHLLSEMGQKCD